VRISLKIAIAVALATVLLAAGLVRADDPPIVIGDPIVFDPPPPWPVRHVSVRPGAPPGDDPQGWLWFAFGQIPPATPDQDSILLTEADPLAIGVPWWGQSSNIDRFETAYTRNGNHLELTGYRVTYAFGVTATEYPPNEYEHRIGSLPPGHYTLSVRSFDLLDTSSGETPLDFAGFQADPAGYAAAHDMASGYSTSAGTYEFTVMPEPSAAMLLVCAACAAVPALWRRRFALR
jgi:hypothetical protein